MRLRCFLSLALASASLLAQQPSAGPTALTIYNQDFAVARTQIDLDLHPGSNEVTTTQVTSQLEPDSVVLRDAAGKSSFHILEQNYDAGVVDQQWLLQKYEGKTIDFQTGGSSMVDGKFVPGPTVPGKIIRAGAQADGYPQSQPLIEVNGQMQFQLPGTPLFPATTDGLLLKPTLRWQIGSEKDAKLSAELAYVTGGFSWEATYNIVAPESTGAGAEDKADVLGWVTIHNQSGSEFPQARIKLMAGDVAKIVPQNFNRAIKNRMYITGASQAVMVEPEVTQKAFDDFHLYDLNRTVSLRNGEIKQIQFIEATGVTLARSYLYDGASGNLQPYSNFAENINQQRNYGLDSANTKVQIVQQIKNSKANHLGIPLPAGRIRLYRRDSDGQMEFVGESSINHTPTEDTVKITTGSAFDIKGTRRQTDFRIDQGRNILDETFEIKLTNQKSQPVTVNVVEHLYRGDNWEIREKSADFAKLDSHTLQFPVQVPAKGEATLTYSVHYSW
jgi:hypothetical protein